jgi:predicted RNase H-like nuclease (RuvC/YqgF family)
MSDTPRTDALRDKLARLGWNSYKDKPVADLCVEMDQLERELVAKTAEFDRLNESLAKNKRLFTNSLADGIIESQLKRIKQLEDHLSLALQAMDNLKRKP